MAPRAPGAPAPLPTLGGCCGVGRVEVRAVDPSRSGSGGRSESIRLALASESVGWRGSRAEGRARARSIRVRVTRQLTTRRGHTASLHLGAEAWAAPRLAPCAERASPTDGPLQPPRRNGFRVVRAVGGRGRRSAAGRVGARSRRCGRPRVLKRRTGWQQRGSAARRASGFSLAAGDAVRRKAFKERQVPCLSNSDDMDDECIEFILCGRRVRSERDWTQNSRRKCGSLKKTGRNLAGSKHRLPRKKEPRQCYRNYSARVRCHLTIIYLPDYSSGFATVDSCCQDATQNVRHPALSRQHPRAGNDEGFRKAGFQV